MGQSKERIEPFEVTLAHPRTDDRIDLSYGAFVQPKLDGVRCYTKLDEDGVVRSYSRNHKEFKNVEHITTWLAPFFKSNPNVILDGELYNHQFKDNFNKIISLVRKTKPTEADRVESMLLLEYHVYDCYHADYVDLRFSQRFEFITDNLSHSLSVRRVETHKVWKQEEIDQLEDMWLNEGYEGAMLRDNIRYEQKRSYGLQKIKRWKDTEFTITGFVEGKGKFEGGLGKFLGVDNDGNFVEVPYPNLKIGDRRRLWQNREEWLGKVGTFIYFERTPAGAYRFPKFKGLRNYE